MHKTLELLLQIEDLVLLKKGLLWSDPKVPEVEIESLDQRIEQLRHQVPGRVLSLHDKLSSDYVDPITALADGVCQGCHQRVSMESQREIVRASGLFQCEHCGRLLFESGHEPDYVA